jgi:hypothetical protein
MSSVLPEIIMPKKEPVAPPPQEQEIPDNKLPEQAGNMELIDELMKENNCDLPEDDIITVDEREIPDEDEVFSDRPPPKVAPVSLEEPEEPVNEFTPKKGKRKYVRKAPMSDKQKEHLAKIRKIAQDKRKLERERKAKEKEDKLVEKAEQKILQKKQKEEEVSKPKPEPKIVPPSGRPAGVVNNGFTKEDLDSAVLSAISQYDKLRKQQKKEKRESDLKKHEEEKMRATLARAIQPQARTAPDPWRNLFS